MFWEQFTVTSLISNLAASGALSLVLVMGVGIAARFTHRR